MPRKRKDRGTLPLFPRVAAAITEEQREYALVQLSDAVENLNRAKRDIERGFHGWPMSAYAIASPRRLLLTVLDDINKQVDLLSVAADNVLNLKPTL